MKIKSRDYDREILYFETFLFYSSMTFGLVDVPGGVVQN